MLISAYRYTRGLDLDARAYAEVTGIALGWLDNEKKTFRCGCWVCEFIVERSCDNHEARLVQATVVIEFEDQLDKYGCLHWYKYMRYHEEAPMPDFVLARQTLRRAATLRARGGAPVPEPIWELEVSDEELEDEDNHSGESL